MKSSRQTCCEFADWSRAREDAVARTLMKKSINAAVYETHGNAADVLRVESRLWPAPSSGEVVVETPAAPINPADLNQIEGKYPIRPQLQATLGFEREGVVLDLG